MSYGHGTFGSDDPNERKFRKYSDSQIVRELAAYILRYRKDFGVVIGTLLLAALFGVVGPSLIGVAVDDIVSSNLRGVMIMVALFAIINVAGYFAESKRLYHMQLLGQNVIYDIRADAFAKLQKLSPSYYSRRETGRIMSYITNDVDALSDFVTFQLPAVLSGVLVIASIIVIMFVYNASLTLVSLTVIPPLVILTLAMQGRIQRSYVETRKKIAVVTSKLQEGISGVRVTQSLAKQEKINERFDRANAENLEANLQANRLTSLFNSLVQVIESFGIAIVLWYGATEILGGQIPVGTLVTFLIYVNSFFNPIIQLTTFYNSYQAAVTGLDRVMQVMHTEVEVKETEPPLVVPEFGKSASAPIEIRFEDVSFGYESGQPPVLKHINLVIEKNSVVAVVGPTGAGKSSMVSLILRFYDPQSGRVTFNGIDLRQLSFKDLRGLISVIPQDPFLFSGTIMDNIRYGAPDASDEQVIEVAKRIGLDEFVRSLPLGFGTVVSEGATNLSMGQKQLICFARAFLPNPRILIMDEATSGVDPYMELQLQKALGTVLEGRTSIIIAHRLSTIRLADKIVVVGDGEIQESGTFSELMKRGKIFAKMYALQTELVE